MYPFERILKLLFLSSGRMGVNNVTALKITTFGSAELRFFYGVSTDVAEGTDIDTLGFTQFGTTISIPAVAGADAQRTGSVDVTSLPAGSTIWMDVTHVAGGPFLLDNITATAIPASGMLFSIR